MGNKIFVSYKYADDDVKNIKENFWETCTVRDYVDEMEKILGDTDHIYKGESDGEDLSRLSENTIWNKLKDRIRDSSITIVMISPNMKIFWKKDNQQWIPREVSYSLSQISRRNKNGQDITSNTNAMIAVILPDRNGAYSYYLTENECCDSKCRGLSTYKLFDILKNNMFNLKNADMRECENNTKIWSGESSYIESVKWEDFVKNIQKYIDKAYDRQDNIENYEICKQV